MRRRTLHEWRLEAELHVETDAYYWMGFRAGMLLALVLVILAALGYLAVAA